MRRYYLPQETGTLKALYKRLIRKERPLPPFPRVIQIQTKSGCPARCVFCPNSIVGPKLTHGEMEWDLFTKIADEITRHSVARISPYLMNEPLLDRRLGDKIRYLADRKQPDTVIKINSNGALLDDETGEQLIESGLDRINFSVHGIRKETYESQMVGLKLEKVLENIDRFLELKKRKGASKPRVRVTMVRTKAIEEELPEIMAYWKARKVKVNVRPLENRAMKEIAATGLNPKKWKPFSFCNRLFEQAYILYNGDVVLCCVDWERTTILGNLREQSLEEIWNSPRFTEIRKRYLVGDLKGLLCQKCLTI
ncbi:MAG: radical SAM protein [Aquificota bacterium]|nr:MAG: radical SAM protein [Aquificota bacterium]